MDLKFPHHECEIAQAEACNGQTPVKYWLHANMLTMNGKKMAKSTGNNILPNEIFSGENNILSKPFAPTVVRFFMMQAHYTSILDLSNEALLASEKGYLRLMDSMDQLPVLATGSTSSFDYQGWCQKCYDAMNDDFNTPILIANLFEAVKQINLIKEGKGSISSADKQLLVNTLNTFVFDVLGLEATTEQGQDSDQLAGVVNLLIQLISPLGQLIEQVLATEPFDEAWFWATHQGAEIDLLLRRGDRLLGVECKRADAPKLTASIRIALDDLGLERVAVIYPGVKRYPLGDSAEAVPLMFPPPCMNTITGSSTVRSVWGDHTLRDKQSSSPMGSPSSSSWGQGTGQSRASSGSLQAWGGTGGLHRSSPVGGAA